MCQRCLKLHIRSPFIPKTVQIKPHFWMVWQQLTAARQTRRAGLRRTCSSGSCISAVTLRLKLEQAAGWGSRRQGGGAGGRVGEYELRRACKSIQNALLSP
jgi:hypothetical protein